MALPNYGVLKGYVIARRHAQQPQEHYNIHVVDRLQQNFRVAVNVCGLRSPHELEYAVIESLQHPITDALQHIHFGFSDLDRKSGGIAMDYLRLHLLKPAQMKALPYSAPGPDNDLNEKLDHWIDQALLDRHSVLYAFGERWGPQAKVDNVFGFEPSRGVHNVHMNQGSAAPYDGENGAWQDGALLLYFPSQANWIGLFLKFQSQSWHTDPSGASSKSMS